MLDRGAFEKFSEGRVNWELSNAGGSASESFSEAEVVAFVEAAGSNWGSEEYN